MSDTAMQARRSGAGEGEAGLEAPDGARNEQIRCDFCGRAAERVRRVALDRGYERLQTPHRVQYACVTCSEAKERERLGHSAALASRARLL